MKDFSNTQFQKQQPVNKQEQELPAKGPRFKLAWILVLAAMLLLGYVGRQLPRYLLMPPKTVRIVGNHFLTKESLVRQLDLREDQSWLDLDPYVLSLRLKKDPWIREVLVRRSVPLGLEVHIKERKPIAFLQTKDQLYLLDEQRWVLELPLKQKNWNLPIIQLGKEVKVETGTQLNSASLLNVLYLMDQLEDSPTLPLASISEIDATNPLNITVITIPQGVKIKFGFREFQQRLKKLQFALESLRQQKKRIDYLDLRHHGGVVFKRVRS
ncbi:MAG: hypothetical protein COB67_13730 [SAR324 cluster bacterium]|uniref:POTRA domain-containing protein n=1 Tax=SAR324 cluster bacterium TaxID=2024889 RepID=A0A2A4SL42_9DELT|nr:MAG: hypothetical protein COB67_13730 [SAR324 cluster bacterium]